MRVLLHSKIFYPSVGGLERVAHNLASYLWSHGVDVRVVTDTPLEDGPEPGVYPVVRCPSASEKRRLVRESDLIQVNGFSLELLPYSLLYRKPLVWRHAGHQASCIAGNGWHAGGPCHHRPWRCFKLSWRERGLRYALGGAARLVLRRVALRLAAQNVAVTDWVAEHIRAPRSVVIWNPVDIDRFPPSGDINPPGRFSFIGRLATEKGCDVLIRALDICRRRAEPFSVDVYGDGPQRERLCQLAQQLDLADAVTFHGTVRDLELEQAIRRSWAVVVPTVCEEALGIVAVEAMAAGRPLIVSERGGLAEVAEGCALVFDNGDAAALSERMSRLFADAALCQRLGGSGPARAGLFAPERVGAAYMDLYGRVLGCWSSSGADAGPPGSRPGQDISEESKE